MSVTFVIGHSCAGKSSYIKKYFSNSVVVDLYNFQDKLITVQSVLDAYDKCKAALIEALKHNDDVVLEHTLSKRIRREDYINAVRTVTDTPIECIVIMPEKDVIVANAEKRGIKLRGDMIDDYIKFFEVPSVEEGFEKVTFISSFDL